MEYIFKTSKPVSVNRMRHELRIPEGIDVDNSLIEKQIIDACSYVSRITGIPIVGQVVEKDWSPWPAFKNTDPICFKEDYVVSVESLSYWGEGIPKNIDQDQVLEVKRNEEDDAIISNPFGRFKAYPNGYNYFYPTDDGWPDFGESWVTLKLRKFSDISKHEQSLYTAMIIHVRASYDGVMDEKVLRTINNIIRSDIN